MEEYPLVAYLVSHLVAVAEHFKNPWGNQPCFKVIGEKPVKPGIKCHLDQ